MIHSATAAASSQDQDDVGYQDAVAEYEDDGHEDAADEDAGYEVTLVPLFGRGALNSTNGRILRSVPGYMDGA